jgi:hypothetical protein
MKGPYEVIRGGGRKGFDGQLFATRFDQTNTNPIFIGCPLAAFYASFFQEYRILRNISMEYQTQIYANGQQPKF